MGDSGGEPNLQSYIMDEETLKRKQKEKLKKLLATGGNPRPARSLFFLTLKNPFRKAAINIVEWKYPLVVRGQGSGVRGQECVGKWDGLSLDSHAQSHVEMM